MSSYYSDDEVDVQVRHVRAPSPRRPPPQHYVQTVNRERPAYSGYRAGPVTLQPERTIIHTRSRSRERRSSPPEPQPQPPPMTMAPVVIHNKIVNEQSDSDDYSDETYHRHRRHGHHSRARAHSRVSSGSDASGIDDARDKWELERAREELSRLRMTNTAEKTDRDREEKLRERESRYKEDLELQRAKKELDDIKRRKQLEEEEKRIRKDIEMKRLEEERRELAAKQEREHAAEEAVRLWKLKEAEKIAKEKAEKEKADKEYQERLRIDLARSGMSEKDIEAILKKEKIKKEDEDKKKEHDQQLARPTYTRMSLRHLEVETLIYYKIDFEYDQVSAPPSRATNVPLCHSARSQPFGYTNTASSQKNRSPATSSSSAGCPSGSRTCSGSTRARSASSRRSGRRRSSSRWAATRSTTASISRRTSSSGCARRSADAASPLACSCPWPVPAQRKEPTSIAPATRLRRDLCVCVSPWDAAANKDTPSAFFFPSRSTKYVLPHLIFWIPGISPLSCLFMVWYTVYFFINGWVDPGPRSQTSRPKAASLCSWPTGGLFGIKYSRMLGSTEEYTGRDSRRQI